MESIDEQYPNSVRSFFHREMKMCGSAGQAALCFRNIQPPCKLLDQAIGASAVASAMSVLCPLFMAPQLKFRMLPTKSFERRLNTKIVVKSQKCSMSAERKSAGRTTPICSEEQPGVFGMSKKSYRWRPADLRIAGSQAANLRTGSRPAPDRGRARGRPIFCRLNAREVILNFTRSARRDSSPL